MEYCEGYHRVLRGALVITYNFECCLAWMLHHFRYSRKPQTRIARQILQMLFLSWTSLIGHSKHSWRIQHSTSPFASHLNMPVKHYVTIIARLTSLMCIAFLCVHIFPVSCLITLIHIPPHSASSTIQDNILDWGWMARGVDWCRAGHTPACLCSILCIQWCIRACFANVFKYS